MKIISLLFSSTRSNQNHKAELIHKLLAVFPGHLSGLTERAFGRLAWPAGTTSMQQPFTPALCSISTYSGLKDLAERCPVLDNIKREKEANTSSGKSAPLFEIWALFLLEFLWFQLPVIDSWSGSVWWIKKSFFSPPALYAGKCDAQSFKYFVAWNILPL